MRYFAARLMCISALKHFSAADVEVKLNEALAAAYIEKLKLIEGKIRHLQRK